MARRKTYTGRLYLGHGEYEWIGRFPTHKARDKAVRDAWAERERRLNVENVTVGDYAERFLARYEREHKASSYSAARHGLSRFLKDFEARPLASITRYEAREWAERNPRSATPVVVTLLNAAVDDELLERNPFRGLTHRTKGRSHEAPPTSKELGRILDACSVLGDYGPMMRALTTFAAYSGMRPGELFALEWADIDFEARRIHVQRRVYGGRLDTPKSGKSKLIALTPPARDALLGLPRDGALVFRSKRGKRMSQSNLSLYWREVSINAGLDFDFYLATKHWCVHYMYATLGLAPRVIAQQMGWALGSVLKMLEVYGHGDIGALEEIDRAFAAGNVTPLRRIRDASEAG